jgi:hypothetical protein
VIAPVRALLWGWPGKPLRLMDWLIVIAGHSCDAHFFCAQASRLIETCAMNIRLYHERLNRFLGMIGVGLFLLPQGILQSASIPVFPGQSIQTAINGGTAGDTVVIFEGTYNEDITVNKLVQLAKPQDANVVLAGSVTLSGLSSPYVLHDFTIGFDRTKKITVSNCSDVILQDLNLASAAGFTVTNTPKLMVLRVNNSGGTGSSVTDVAKFETKHCRIDGNLSLSKSNSILRQGTYASVSSTQGDCFLLGGSVSSLSVSDLAKSGAAGTGDSTAVVFQSSVVGLALSVQRSWIGYSDLRSLDIQAGINHVIVGNNFDGKGLNAGNGAHDRAIWLRMNVGAVKILNNVIRNYGWGEWGGSVGIGVHIEASNKVCLIVNNLISGINRGGYSGYGGWREGGVGVRIEGARSSSNPVVIKSNIFERMSQAGVDRKGHAVWGSFANVEMTDNVVHKYNGWISGLDNGAAGVVATNTTELAAPVVWEPSTFFKLPANSPLLDKGPNDARFNDFDGTRGDPGIWGGTQFDPEGRTTTKPVVFGFDITPDQILEGTATQVKLMNIGAVMIEP